MASTVLRMLKASPGAPVADDTLVAEAITEAADCAQACVACASACLAERQVESLRRCIRLNLDCADACEAVARIMLRPHDPELEVLRRMLEVVTLACRASAEECNRHAVRHEHCRLCAEACARCADVCTRLRETLDRLPAGAATRH
jgi:hypothetical protein